MLNIQEQDQQLRLNLLFILTMLDHYLHTIYNAEFIIHTHHLIFIFIAILNSLTLYFLNLFAIRQTTMHILHQLLHHIQYNKTQIQVHNIRINKHLC